MNTKITITTRGGLKSQLGKSMCHNIQHQFLLNCINFPWNDWVLFASAYTFLVRLKRESDETTPTVEKLSLLWLVNSTGLSRHSRASRSSSDDEDSSLPSLPTPADLTDELDRGWGRRWPRREYLWSEATHVATGKGETGGRSKNVFGSKLIFASECWMNHWRQCFPLPGKKINYSYSTQKHLSFLDQMLQRHITTKYTNITFTFTGTLG